MTLYNYTILIVFSLTFSNSLAQTKKKPDLYLFFKEDLNTGMIKQERTDEHATLKNGKIISSKRDYSIYTFRDKSNSSHYKLSTINKSVFCIKDGLFAKKHAISYLEISTNKNIYYDSRDSRNFPYEKVFVVEYINENEYKVIQVHTYMGSDY